MISRFSQNYERYEKLKLPRSGFELMSPYLLPTSMKISAYIIIIIYSLDFFTSALTNGFYWSLSDSKFPQVSRTLLSILAVLNNSNV